MIFFILVPIVLVMEVYQDLFFGSREVVITSNQLPDINSTIFLNGKRIDCLIPTQPHHDSAIKPSISKKIAIEMALEELEKLDSPLEVTTFDWKYHYFHNENITQSFPLESFDTVDLTKEEYDMMLNYKFLLGRYHNNTTPILYLNSDGSHSLRQQYTNGESCEEVGIKRDTIINYSCGVKDQIVSVQEYSVCKYLIRIQTNKICSVPYFQPFEMQERSPIFCNIVGFSGSDTLLFGAEYCMDKENCAWIPVEI
jgi:hypothetical protein